MPEEWVFAIAIAPTALTVAGLLVALPFVIFDRVPRIVRTGLGRGPARRPLRPISTDSCA